MATTTAAEKRRPGEGGVQRLPRGLPQPAAARPDLRQVGRAGPVRAGQTARTPGRADAAASPVDAVLRAVPAARRRQPEDADPDLRALERDGLAHPHRRGRPFPSRSPTSSPTSASPSTRRSGGQGLGRDPHGRGPRRPRRHDAAPSEPPAAWFLPMLVRCGHAAEFAGFQDALENSARGAGPAASTPAGCQSSTGLPSGPCRSANVPFGRSWDRPRLPRRPPAAARPWRADRRPGS